MVDHQDNLNTEPNRLDVLGTQSSICSFPSGNLVYSLFISVAIMFLGNKDLALSCAAPSHAHMKLRCSTVAFFVLWAKARTHVVDSRHLIGTRQVGATRSGGLSWS